MKVAIYRYDDVNWNGMRTHSGGIIPDEIVEMADNFSFMNGRLGYNGAATAIEKRGLLEWVSRVNGASAIGRACDHKIIHG